MAVHWHGITKALKMMKITLVSCH